MIERTTAIALGLIMTSCLGIALPGCQFAPQSIVKNSVHPKLQVELAAFGPARDKEKIWMLPRGKQVFEVRLRGKDNGDASLIVPPGERLVCVFYRLLDGVNGNRYEQALQQIETHQMSSSRLPDGTISLSASIEVIPAPKMATDGTFWLKIIDKNNQDIFVQQYDYLR